MDIKRVAIDAVNETIVMTVVHMDYKGQVAKRINEKMPLATVKGFRKGAVPKDLVEKQYGRAIKQEEVQKVVDLALERFVQSERLNLLGTPLPKVNEDFSWDAEELVFEYEIGLVPNFELDLDAKNDIVKYVVIADDKLINGQVERIQKQFGTAIPQEVVTADSDVTGTFTNEEKGINNATTIAADLFKDKATFDKFIGKKVGDVVTVNTKGLFEDDHQLMDVMQVSHDEVHGLDVDVNFTIEAINKAELAGLNQELFDKLFGPGAVSSLEELKAKIKEDAENQFAQQADQKLLADVTDFLIENTKFDLPGEFLKKWLQTVGEKKLSPEEAEVEYTRSEKGLRFQLIEGKAMAQSDIKINFEELKTFTTNNIKQRMAQYGQAIPSDEEIQTIVARVLSNQDEVKRLSAQVVAEKLLDMFKEKAQPTTKEVTYDEFIAASYGE
ncbi:MAG TPA: trigger factor [Flavobacterium sp.]|jgi:trigger factor|uniref:trigger factor n=1 Tax=Flavobacterium sp. TaxID=239 RepID=UPI001B3DF8D9|nr:trigger factor [Flavobacterium sp.]MBP6146050.1 trigger factor [Flavobacterium sp.]MBP7181684.1 trigger factor [Flavobacterium sp.]MBP7317759.1 trigger factor [Flavobacterium sp.]MBP8887155.1 trigger factor [Flavobacterium sp.]HRL70691.1 trigger factor [Flavobacterium sp.]